MVMFISGTCLPQSSQEIMGTVVFSLVVVSVMVMYVDVDVGQPSTLID
jgi:hypothetical protein